MSFNWVKRVLRKNRYTAKKLEKYFFAKNFFALSKAKIDLIL